MTLARLRAICLKFPHATEQIQWQNDLVFKIGGKMFAVARLEDSGSSKSGTPGNALSFKCSPEEFALLIECEGVVPAPYLARAHWASLAELDTLGATELSRRLRESYELVLGSLPKRAQAALSAEPGGT